MDKIVFGDEITLDNNQVYVCFNRLDYLENSYIYLVNKKNNNDIKIAKEINGKELGIVFVTDKNLLNKLTELLQSKNS